MLLLGKFLIYALIILIVSVNNAFAEDNPCTASPPVITLSDRGGNADSPCIIPVKTAFLEGGYLYQNLIPSGQLQTYPQGEFRIGLPAHSEIGLFLPNYNTPFSGYGPFGFDIKHQFGAGKNWIFSTQTTFILPGGSSVFGSKGLGASMAGIMTYNLNDQWSLTGMLQIGSFTEPTIIGGERYISFTPDLVLSYSPIERLTLYGEVYSLSPVGPNQGDVTLVDYGLLYMLVPQFAIDVGVYHQLGNNPNQFKNAFGGGFTLVL
ncbi:transporter [Legionella cardiaca]|uniref:Transporter n=1 Tax=Legionella cardiaca TaxID=1071983 RepID=A0ABY8ANM9_9GAMM|nr:transporter [Legionella cardiaca]WED41861.1 transporter [Legionella cardiaca]